ncbi:HutD family protein [Kitasatospora sp. GP82]|uniref:HutD/Ves family protein n=1 Tax=Kitasatospora sp. GP82 TaxID=3035089 RepID=UPI002473B514|nr:HutD family protein [Kitasatospora sp. GP82]MDH6128207.1 environmental stress-induced protein Ves [Kitasatospora sp. GP82]
MAVQVLRADERVAAPWLNGGGVTREVAGFPAGAGLTEFVWRVSLADVAQGGPFSRFEGVDRVITVVEGAGMALTVAGAEHRLAQPYRPFAFSGEAETECRLLGGPVVDFNVMTRRGRARAEVEIADYQRPVKVPHSAVVLLVCLSGTAELGAAHLRLARYDAVLLDRGEDLLRVDGVAAVVTIHQLP